MNSAFKIQEWKINQFFIIFFRKLPFRSLSSFFLSISISSSLFLL